jgi:hypothetical protein
MKGLDKVMYEINHPGNKPFMIGLAVTTSALLYMYFGALGSPAAEKESKYWQRFHAKKEHH